MSGPEITEGAAKKKRTRRFYRSITNRSVAGVCGGLGEAFNLDIGVIRLVWLIAAFLTLGVALLPYAALALLLSKETPEHAATKPPAKTNLWNRIHNNGALLWGSLLLLTGAVLLLNNFNLLPWRLETIWRTFWALALPLLLIGLGVFLVLSFMGRAPDWRHWRQLRASGSKLPLRRSPDDRVIAGVCGGIAAYLDIDSLVVRIGWVVLSVLTAGILGGLLYLAAALLVPVKTEPLQAEHVDS